MGNCSSTNQHHHPSGNTARVILWDGSVRCFNDNITAAELMLEHPGQVVVEFDPTTGNTEGKRVTPLHADRTLHFRRIYIMLPVKGGKPVSLSSDGARRVISVANSLLGSRSFLPLLAKMCTTAEVVQDEVLKKDGGAKLEDMTMKEQDAWCGTEYLSRQISGKGWKPSLDTIVEKKMANRVPHWLFSSYVSQSLNE